MRVIVYSGKGGTGKTTVSAATALRSADLGYRTLLVSTDSCPTLADVLETPLTNEPREVATRLWAQEINILADLQQTPSGLRQQISELIGNPKLAEAVWDPAAILLAMEGALRLLRLHKQLTEGQFECVVIDTASTGELTRLLTLPETFRWYAASFTHSDNGLGQLLGSLASFTLRTPRSLPHVVAALDRVAADLQRILSDPETSSYRIVVNPDKMALRHGRQATACLSLCGFPVDGIVVNKVGPAMSEREQAPAPPSKYVELTHQAFRLLPLWEVPHYPDEVAGSLALSQLARDCFGDSDPAAILYRGPRQELVQEPGKTVLRIPVPSVDIQDIRLRKRGAKLLIVVGSFHREMTLPAALAHRPAVAGRLVSGVLEVVFFDAETSRHTSSGAQA